MTAPAADTEWLVGRGIADVTGEPWRVGMMGYGMRFQRTTGIQLRQRARAFVIVHRPTGGRLAFVVADIGMFFGNVTAAVLAGLDPATYGPDNVLLTATHTHAGVGGYSCYRLYNMTTDGFRPRTFRAMVDGVVTAIRRAEGDLAPGQLSLARGELRDANVNRSPQAFARNPESDRDLFPEAVDPTTTLLRFERAGRLVGVVNWFATHGTSLSNRNTLISGDNKGYAAYRWEREIAGVDYLERPDEPAFVAGFAQTNAGDMSPNVPDATCGPTDDEVENSRVIGERQFDAAYALSAGPAAEVTGGIDTRITYVSPGALTVDQRFTGDGRAHRTGRAVLGAAFAAGTKEGRGARAFHEGVDDNPVLSMASRAAYACAPQLRDAQSPKALLIPVGALRWTADRVPLQLVRLGRLVLVTLAHEVTIVAGLRLRRTVAQALALDVDDVLVQGYANDYAGYLTTPEEYDAQRYEGGHTMFGRWQLPAYQQEADRLALALREGASVSAQPPRLPVPRGRPRADSAVRCTGIALRPGSAYAPGDEVRAEFAVTTPGGDLLPAYCVVERDTDGTWRRVADDGDWSLTIEWRRGSRGWVAAVTWAVPQDAAGAFRISYLDRAGLHPTAAFTVA